MILQSPTYALIARHEPEDKSWTFWTLDVEGDRVLPLYTSPDAAEAHLLLRNHGPAWQVIGGPARDLSGLLLEWVAPHVEYIVLDPPIAFEDGPPVEVEPVPIHTFVGRLVGL